MLYNLEFHSVPVGCEHCYYTGFSGRKAICELIPMETEVSQSIRDNKMNVQEIKSLEQLKFLKEAAGNCSLLNKQQSMRFLPTLFNALDIFFRIAL